MMYPKTEYIRSQKHLKAVASLSCMNCGAIHNVQAAHANWSEYGKGKGIKASDIYTAALCLSCHYEIDQGANLTKNQRKELWVKAHKKTVETLVMNREWIASVPLPDVGKFD
jgi:hypothetical protein